MNTCEDCKKITSGLCDKHINGMNESWEEGCDIDPQDIPSFSRVLTSDEIEELSKLGYPSANENNWKTGYKKLIEENWKEPEWQWKRHEALIDYVKVLIGKTESFISQTLQQQREEMKRKIPALRRWLNEDRITDASKMISSEMIERWLLDNPQQTGESKK